MPAFKTALPKVQHSKSFKLKKLKIARWTVQKIAKIARYVVQFFFLCDDTRILSGKFTVFEWFKPISKTIN